MDNKFTTKLNSKRDEAKVYSTIINSDVNNIEEVTLPQGLIDLRNIRDLNKMMAQEFETLIDIYIDRAEIAGESLSISSIPETIRRQVLPLDKLILTPREYINILLTVIDESSKAGYNKVKNGGNGQINQSIEAFISYLPTPPPNMFRAATHTSELSKLNTNNAALIEVLGQGDNNNPPENATLGKANENVAPMMATNENVYISKNADNIINECIPCFFNLYDNIGFTWELTFGKNDWWTNYLDLSIADAVNTLRNLLNAKLGAISGQSFSRHLCTIQGLWNNKRCLPEIAMIIAAIRALIMQIIASISKLAELGFPGLNVTGSIAIGLDITVQAFVKVLLNQAMQMLFTITNLIDCTINSLNEEARKATQGLNAVIDGWNDTGGRIEGDALFGSEIPADQYTLNGDGSLNIPDNANSISAKANIKIPPLTVNGQLLPELLVNYRKEIEDKVDGLMDVVKKWAYDNTIVLNVSLNPLSSDFGLDSIDDSMNMLSFFNSLLYMFKEIEGYAKSDLPIDKSLCAVAAYVEQPWINIIANDLIDDILGGGGDDDSDGSGDGSDGIGDDGPQEGEVRGCDCSDNKTSIQTFLDGKWTECGCESNGEPFDPTIPDGFVSGPVGAALTNGFINDILKLDKKNIIDQDLINLYNKNMKSLLKVNLNNKTAYYVGAVSSSKCVPSLDGLKSIFDIKDWSKG